MFILVFLCALVYISMVSNQTQRNFTEVTTKLYFWILAKELNVPIAKDNRYYKFVTVRRTLKIVTHKDIV